MHSNNIPIQNNQGFIQGMNTNFMKPQQQQSGPVIYQDNYQNPMSIKKKKKNFHFKN